MDVPPQGKEPEGLAQARETLGLALCNRSVVNFTVGNVFNGKVRLGMRRLDPRGQKAKRLSIDGAAPRLI